MEDINTVHIRNYEGDSDELMAWAVYSTSPKKELAAAFYERDDAQWLHEQLAESEEPVLVPASHIDCAIDEYKEFVKQRAGLYTVVLESGSVSRQDTYDSQVFNLREPAFEPGLKYLLVPIGHFR